MDSLSQMIQEFFDDIESMDESLLNHNCKLLVDTATHQFLELATIKNEMSVMLALVLDYLQFNDDKTWLDKRIKLGFKKFISEDPKGYLVPNASLICHERIATEKIHILKSECCKSNYITIYDSKLGRIRLVCSNCGKKSNIPKIAYHIPEEKL